MSHPDLKKTFEEIFSDCWYDIIRQAGIALNQDQIDKLRHKCDRAAQRIAIRLEMQTMIVCDALQKRVAEGFEKVQADVAALAKEVEELKK